MQVIDNRLLAAASFVRADSVVADIGCDHGKLSVYLAQQKKAKKVIAVDLRPMPLAKAKTRVQRLLLADKVECRLGDGLNAIAEGEVNDIIIAGMSGVTIYEIINAIDWSKDKALRFILVPASKADFLRLGLAQNGYEIIDETPAEAAGRVYPVICAKYNAKPFVPTDIYCLLGKCLEKKSNEAKALREKVVSQLEKQLKGVPEKFETERINQLIRQIRQIKE